MSHKIIQTTLITAILVTQITWSQPRPGAERDSNIALRGRSTAERNMQADMASQLESTQSQIKKLEAEQRKLNAELKTIQTLATQEKATKTLSQINQLIKTRNAQYNAQIKSLDQKVRRIKTTLVSFAKRNQAENRIDTMAPAFSATSVTGEKISSHQFKDKVVVLQWFNPECQFTRFAYQRGKIAELADQYANRKDVTWLGICSTASNRPGSLPEFVKKHKIEHPVIHDTTGQIAKLYYAKSTPHFMIVGKDGKIVYSGAFDNSLPRPKNGRVTGYVANALTEILQGKPVTIPTVPSTGTPISTARR